MSRSGQIGFGIEQRFVARTLLPASGQQPVARMTLDRQCSDL